MQIKDEEVEFEWDKGNRDKIYAKHGITTNEAEEVFADTNSIVLPDIGHSLDEERLVIVGRNLAGTRLHIVFTLRRGKIRVISARRMHKKEVARYEKIKKDSTF